MRECFDEQVGRLTTLDCRLDSDYRIHDDYCDHGIAELREKNADVYCIPTRMYHGGPPP